ARVGDQDCEVVSALVAALSRTRRTPCEVVATVLSLRPRQMLKNREFPARRIAPGQEWTGDHLRRRRFQWNLQASDKAGHLFFRDSFQAGEVCDLRFSRVVGSIEPEPLPDATVNAERTAYCVAELGNRDLVLLGKHLNPVCQRRTSW